MCMVVHAEGLGLCMLRDWGCVCWCMLRGGAVYAEGLGMCMLVHAEGWGCVWW